MTGFDAAAAAKEADVMGDVSDAANGTAHADGADAPAAAVGAVLIILSVLLSAFCVDTRFSKNQICLLITWLHHKVPASSCISRHLNCSGQQQHCAGNPAYMAMRAVDVLLFSEPLNTNYPPCSVSKIKPSTPPVIACVFVMLYCMCRCV